MEGQKPAENNSKAQEKIQTPLERIKAAATKMRSMENFGKALKNAAQFEVVVRIIEMNPGAPISQEVISDMERFQILMDDPATEENTKALQNFVEAAYNRLEGAFKRTGQTEQWERIVKGDY